MFDSIDVAALPSWATHLAGYVNGSWPTYGAVVAAFPHATVLSVAVSADADADCLDVESGDATPAQVPAWVARQQARGAAQPCVYANASTMPAVVAGLAAAGVGRGAYRLWSAHYSTRHVCGPASCAYPGVPACDGTQWTDVALGRSLDESELLPTFFGAPPAPPPLEDTMMLNTGTGAETIILLAAGSAKGVVFGNDSTLQGSAAPQLRVAVHSAAKGWDQVVHATVTASGTTAVTFTQPDVDMLNVERQATGADTPTGWVLVQ